MFISNYSLLAALRKLDTKGNLFTIAEKNYGRLIEFISPFGPATKPSSDMCINEINFLI